MATDLDLQITQILTADVFDEAAFREIVTENGGPDTLQVTNIPIGWAAMMLDNSEALRTLLNMGMNPNQTHRNTTLAERAIDRELTEIVSVLQEAGADFTFLQTSPAYGSDLSTWLDDRAFADFLHEAGLIPTPAYLELTEGEEQELRSEAARWPDGASPEFWEAYDENVTDFGYSIERTTHTHIVTAGQGMWRIADMFNEIIGDGVTIPEAITAIAEANGLDAGAAASGEYMLHPNDELDIPLGDERRIFDLIITDQTDFSSDNMKGFNSLWEIAEYYQEAMGFPDDTMGAFVALAEINGIDPEAALRDGFSVINEEDLDNPALTDRHSNFIIPVFDDFRFVEPLRPAPFENDNATDVVVIEFAFNLEHTESNHRRDTTRVARGISGALAPDADPSRITSVMGNFTSSMISDFDVPDRRMDEAMRVLMRSEDAAAGRVVFSYSMSSGAFETPSDEEDAYQRHIFGRHDLDEIEFWNELDPIVFYAAVNDYDDGRVYEEGGFFRHGNRTVRVGAVGEYHDSDRAIAHYSDIGADICAPMTDDLARQYHGTSFAAPFMAGAYRTQSERYGESDILPDGLDFDEFLATAMISARRDIFELDDREGDTEAELTLYDVNAGGLPYHDRCGAGLLDVYAWDELNEELIRLKQDLDLDTAPAEHQIAIDTQSYEIRELDGENATEYVYRITVPENMTLGNLTFYLPQDQDGRGPIVMESPSGDQMALQQSVEGVTSTRRFMLEDVQAGDEIILRSSFPLEEGATLFLRGFEEGSALSVLRDTMLLDGRLPAPLQSGYSVAPADATPAPPAPAPEDIAPLQQRMKM